MQAEEDASDSFPMDSNKYNNWFSGRRNDVINFIGAPYTANFNVSTAGGSTTGDFHDISGTSPSGVFTVRVLERPDAIVAWTSTTGWTLSNLALAQGVNTFTVQALDRDGKVIESSSYSITKTDNAPPIVELASEPGQPQPRRG